MASSYGVSCRKLNKVSRRGDSVLIKSCEHDFETPKASLMKMQALEIKSTRDGPRICATKPRVTSIAFQVNNSSIHSNTPLIPLSVIAGIVGPVQAKSDRGPAVIRVMGNNRPNIETIVKAINVSWYEFLEVYARISWARHVVFWHSQ